MSIRHLDALFDPASVAVIGASERPARVGSTVWRNLRTSGFRGRVDAVNPKYTQLGDAPCVGRVAELAQVPELAVICTPAATVPGLVAELGARGAKAAIVLGAGLDAATRQAMLDAARPHTLRILGPNGLGAIVPAIGLNASFAHAPASAGSLAFVSQSGALVTAMLDWARARGIGFSKLVSLGEHADIDFGDMLDYLASDATTRAILLYIESIEAAPKFMSAARAAARNKPVIVVKAGRSEAGQRAAASHTGALAGADLVVDAAIRRAGMLRVETLQDLFLAAQSLARLRELRADSLVIVTNGGGAGVMAADAAAAAGVALAELDATTLARLDAVLPPTWSRANPVDLIGDAPVERYVQALTILAEDPARPALLFAHAPTAIVPAEAIAQALQPVLQPLRERVLACWLGDGAVAAARQRFADAALACFDTPEDAVRAFAMLQTYRRNQALLMQAPPRAAPPAPQADRARAVLAAAQAEGHGWLDAAATREVLGAYGIATLASAATPPEPAAAVAAAEALGWPVALKIASPDLPHKSDVGGVVLDLGDAAALEAAARSMLGRIARLRPAARLVGFTVQAMARRGGGRELLVGATVDPTFGPVVLFGHGGTTAELVADRAVALPPLDAVLARELVDRTRVARLLGAWRDTPAADREALHAVLVAVAALLADLPQLAELDLNPLVVDAQGAVVLDARLRVAGEPCAGAARFAIAPYPAELTRVLDWHGRRVTVRPIRPQDEAQHLAFLQRLDPEDIRMRIFYSRRTIERSELARLTQIDYAREMAFVATAPEGDGEATLGVVRAIADPDNVVAEFGIVVRSDLKGEGLGELLLARLIEYLRERGTQRLVATVLRANRRMLELAAELGFVQRPGEPGSDTCAIERALSNGR